MISKFIRNVAVALVVSIIVTQAVTNPVRAAQLTSANIYAEAEVTVIVDALNVRTAPSLQGQIIGHLGRF